MSDFEVPSLNQMWDALTPEEKQAACECLFTSNDDTVTSKSPPVIRELALANRFREKFIQGKSADEKTQLLWQRIHTPDFAIYRDDLICAWLVERCRPVLCRFLDAASVTHKNGLYPGDSETESPSQEACERALETLTTSESQRDAALYVAYLLHYEKEQWPHLPAALAQTGLSLTDALEPRDPEKQEASVQKQASSAEASPPPEDSESFTTLDHLLIRSAVDTAFGQEGALSPDQLEDLIEETVELNAGRHRSLFHRGFLHSLFEREYQFHFPGENEERRVWYFTGALLGLLRRSATDECLRLLDAEKKLTRAVCEHPRCAMMVLRQIWDALFETGRLGLLQNWIEAQIPAWNPREAAMYLHRLHDNAAALLRRGESAEALTLLLFIEDRLKDARQLSTKFVQHLRPFNDRKIAQAYQSQGSLSAAESILEKVIADEHFDSKGNATTDLALIKGGFRSLKSILPEGDRKVAQTTLDSLEKSVPLLRDAVEKHRNEAVNANFCMGIYHTLKGEGQAKQSADYLKAAASGMAAREELYAEGRLIEWNRFLLGLALLETAEPADHRGAADRLNQAMDHDTVYPLWLWERALNAAGLFDDQGLSRAICNHILKSREPDTAMDIVARREILERHPEVIPEYLSWLAAERIKPAQKWKRLNDLLEIALATNRIREADDILDAMEGMALENSGCRKRLIKLLGNEDAYSPAWTEREAETRLIHLNELSGNNAEAATLLEKHFYEDQEREWSHALYLKQLVAHIESLRVEGIDTESLNSRITPETGEEAGDGDIGEVHILYVGGNEKQQGYEVTIRERLLERHPALKVEFFFPGWSSNWSKTLDQILNRLPGTDAVVLNSLVRTNFGRALRAKCNGATPWFPCNGRGEQALRLSICRAAKWATAAKAKA